MEGQKKNIIKRHLIFDTSLFTFCCQEVSSDATGYFYLMSHPVSQTEPIRNVRLTGQEIKVSFNLSSVFGFSWMMLRDSDSL